MTDKILEWLSKTGCPLELYVESVLSEVGFLFPSSSNSFGTVILYLST